MKKSLAAVAVLLSGCMSTASELSVTQPRVSDFNGMTVKVLFHPYAVGNNPRSPVYQKASEICATVGKRAEFGAVRHLGGVGPYQGEHTYLCL